jgi:ABC-type transport system involved in cytochrome c biogenesis ATPase subunit
MIDEINIENFRGFTSLTLPSLKRVNLIVGENNAGKTSLLEAILLLCDAEQIHSLPHQFRPSQGDPNLRYFRWMLRDGTPDKVGNLQCSLNGKRSVIFFGTPSTSNGLKIPTEFSSEPFHSVRNTPQSLSVWKLSGIPSLTCRSISVFQQQHDHRSLVTLVGRAQRKSGGEETLQNLLAKVDPRIKKIRVDPGTDGSQDGNQVIVDIGLSELMPLTQTGQGVHRLMSILADIIGESPDVLLIDEIENGLHHSVQQQIWTGLAEAAEKLNVQIFATTHSDECLRAANAAFQNRPNYDFSVIQLFRVKSGVQGRVLDKQHIEAAISGNIDLR